MRIWLLTLQPPRTEPSMVRPTQMAAGSCSLPLHSDEWMRCSCLAGHRRRHLPWRKRAASFSRSRRDVHNLRLQMHKSILTHRLRYPRQMKRIVKKQVAPVPSIIAAGEKKQVDPLIQKRPQNFCIGPSNLMGFDSLRQMATSVFKDKGQSFTNESRLHRQ